MPDMPSDIATMAGYGIDFTLIVQGIDQLKDHYGKAAAALLSNCAYKWFCNVLDLESAKYLSDTLGKTTVRTVGQSEGENQGPGGASKSEGKSYGETGRLLLAPDEVLTLGRDVAIVLNPEGHPLYVHPVDYWQLKDAFRHLAGRTLRFTTLRFDENPYHAAGKKKAGQGGEQKKQAPPKSSTGPMSRRRALSILGLAEGATPAEINAAYKRLVKKLHPDVGGTDGLAVLLNEARAVLLAGKAA
jgi:type IV secretory pathway TraG/TraD family ATPase VirD4